VPSKKDTGKTGELAALKYLKNEGYVILHRNYRNMCGEIDLIARKDGYLVFIEVKTRTGLNYGDPLESVDAAKIKKIRKAAALYTAGDKNLVQDIRFDVVAVTIDKDLAENKSKNNSSIKIEHIKDAF
jgi:putative endonuclease